jgi:hypothetical protein
MALGIRIVCIAGAVAMFMFITSNIRKKKVQIEDSLFWMVLSLMLVLIAVFPQIAFDLSAALGFKAPSNFVIVGVVAILLMKLFSLSTEVSSLRHRLNELAQEEALIAKEKDEAGEAIDKISAALEDQERQVVDGQQKTGRLHDE